MRTGQINGRDKLVCETYKIAFEYALKLYIKLKKENMNIKEIIKEGLLPEKSIPFINKNIIKRIECETIYVGDGVNNRFITLNETAQRVLALCDGNNNLSDITNIMINEFECEYDIYSDISEIISSFLDAGIIKLSV